MKRINEFFNSASMWKVYIISWLITSITVSTIFYIMSHSFMNDDFTATWTFIMYLKFGAYAGIMFGLMLTLMISINRSNRKFWNYAEEVEKLVNIAETEEELNRIYHNEFSKLRGLTSGTPHYHEANRIYTILKTKLNMICK